MADVQLRSISIRLFETGTIRPEDVTELRRTIGDGFITREDAEVLLAIERRARAHCAEWSAFLAETIAAHLVWERRPTGYVPPDDAAWLLACLTAEGEPTPNARALAFAVVCEAEGADESLVAFALGADAASAMSAASDTPAARLRAVA